MRESGGEGICGGGIDLAVAHCAAQIRADVAIIYLDCVFESDVGALVLIELIVATLDAYAEPVDISDGGDDGAGLDENGGELVTCAAGAHVV